MSLSDGAEVALGLSSPSSASPSPASIDHQKQSRFSRLFTPQRASSELDAQLSSTPPKASLVEGSSSGLSGPDWLGTGAGGLSGLHISNNQDDDKTVTLSDNNNITKDGFSFLDDPAGDDFFLRSRVDSERNPSSAVSPKPNSINDFFTTNNNSHNPATSPTQAWSTGFIGSGSPGVERSYLREREGSESWTGVGAEWGSAPGGGSGPVNSNNSWSAAVGSSSASSSPVSTRSYLKQDNTSSAISFTTPPLLSSPAFASSAFSSLPNASLLPRLTATVQPFVPKPLPSQSIPLPPPVPRDQPRVSSPVNTFGSASLGAGQASQGELAYQRAPGSLSSSGPARAQMGLTRPVGNALGLGQQPPQQFGAGRMSYPPAGPKQPGFTNSGQPTAPAPPPPEPSVRTWPIVKVENIPFVS